MSPVRAEGINLALRDAIVAANHLVPVLRDDAEAYALEAACRAVGARTRDSAFPEAPTPRGTRTGGRPLRELAFRSCQAWSPPTTADCSDVGLTAPLYRPSCLTVGIVSHAFVPQYAFMRSSRHSVQCHRNTLSEVRGLRMPARSWSRVS